MFPVRYELGFLILEDDILHSHRRESLRSYKDYAPHRVMPLPQIVLKHDLPVANIVFILASNYNNFQHIL
jgi:hypothetical protein